MGIHTILFDGNTHRIPSFDEMSFFSGGWTPPLNERTLMPSIILQNKRSGQLSRFILGWCNKRAIELVKKDAIYLKQKQLSFALQNLAVEGIKTCVFRYVKQLSFDM